MVPLRKILPGPWILLAILFSSTPALAITRVVDSNQALMESLDLAAAGDTILVLCGVYQAEGMTFPDGVILRSETGEPDCVEIQSAGGSPIITFEATAGNTGIEGMTFTTLPDGLTDPVPRGAGLLIKGSSPSVSNCVFQNLTADYGGAVYCGDRANPDFFQCEFLGNEALGAGSAINCVGNSEPIIVSCLFTGGPGGLQYYSAGFLNSALGSRPRIFLCTVAGDLALSCWDDAVLQVRRTIIVGGAWLGDRSSVPEFTCTNLYYGGADPWTGMLSDQAGLNGNLSADPLFCGDAGGGRPFTLDATSPCANANCGLIGAFPVGCSLSAVGDEIPSGTVLDTGLAGNYPNPFNPMTAIRYNLARAGKVRIAIYDIGGRLVRELVNGTLPGGSHETSWNGRTGEGRPCPTGVYFVHLKTDTTQDTDRLSLIK